MHNWQGTLESSFPGIKTFSNAVDHPIWQYKCPMECPIKIFKCIKFVTSLQGTPPCDWIVAFCVCSHMTSTSKMGGFSPNNPERATPPAPPRCYHKCMFSAILGSFDNMTIVHTHLSGWGLSGIPMDSWRQSLTTMTHSLNGCIKIDIANIKYFIEATGSNMSTFFAIWPLLASFLLSFLSWFLRKLRSHNNTLMKMH